MTDVIKGRSIFLKAFIVTVIFHWLLYIITSMYISQYVKEISCYVTVKWCTESFQS